RKVANQAMQNCQLQYEEVCHREKVKPIGKIKTLEYNELLKFATEKIGNKAVEAIKQRISGNSNLDERKMSIYICDELMEQFEELLPALVLFFPTPYNLAINSSEDSLVQQKIVEIKEILHNHFQTEEKQVHFFNVISDLSK